MNESDNEFEAMQTVYQALVGLDEDAQKRVFSYVASRLRIAAGASLGAGPSEHLNDKDGVRDSSSFSEFGELFDAFEPRNDAEKALSAAYWSSVFDQEESFDSQRLNTMLKNLGHGITNITRALGALADQRPSLVIQTRKSGTSKQARKTYKITRSGISFVEARTLTD
ncbi:hypothetical protein AAG594_05470 [Citromicrobium bathyomarinum]